MPSLGGRKDDLRAYKESTKIGPLRVSKGPMPVTLTSTVLCPPWPAPRAVGCEVGGPCVCYYRPGPGSFFVRQ